MNRLISAIGVTVVSACCLQASDDGYRNRLGAACAQTVLQHMGYVKTDSNGHQVTPAGIKTAKLGLIQTHKQFKELLDRQRINDTPITQTNYKQYPNLNTQVIYNATDKIIWSDDVVKYVIDTPIMINSGMEQRILDPNRDFELIDSLSSGGDFCYIYFIRDRKFLKDFTVRNEYNQGINGGFFMFKFPKKANLRNLGDKVYSPECDEMSLKNPAYIFVDDEGKTSPVSNIKDDTKISQPGVNKVLARRVEFRKLLSVRRLFDAVRRDASLKVFDDDRRDALRKVFDEVCGPNHGNRFLLDEDSKIEMATRALEKEKGRQLTNAEKADVIIRIEDYFGRTHDS